MCRRQRWSKVLLCCCLVVELVADIFWCCVMSHVGHSSDFYRPPVPLFGPLLSFAGASRHPRGSLVSLSVFAVTWTAHQLFHPPSFWWILQPTKFLFTFIYYVTVCHHDHHHHQHKHCHNSYSFLINWNFRMKWIKKSKKSYLFKFSGIHKAGIVTMATKAVQGKKCSAVENIMY